MFKYTNCVDVAQGAFGTIVRAVQTTADGKATRLVALKRLVGRQHNERNPIQQNPQREVEIMTQLNHPNIVKCVDCFQEDSYTYIVMPFCPLSLADVIYGPRQLATRVVQVLAYQILSGIEYIHRQGLAHKDLKPRNILLSNYGKAMISDFGQAYQTIPAAGTRNYRAPEGLLNIGYEAPGDIFACGCILFEMSARRPLFTACNDIELIVQENQIIGPLQAAKKLGEQATDLSKIVLESDFEPMSGLRRLCRDHFLDQELEDLLCGMLNPDADARLKAQECLGIPFVAEGNMWGAGVVQEWLEAEDKTDAPWGTEQ